MCGSTGSNRLLAVILLLAVATHSLHTHMTPPEAFHQNRWLRITMLLTDGLPFAQMAAMVFWVRGRSGGSGRWLQLRTQWADSLRS